MSKRERLSWKNRKQTSRQASTNWYEREASGDNWYERQAGNWYERTADPYTMNQDRTHVPVEEYMTGDPSSWAEDPVRDLSDMDGTDRDELGLPALQPEAWSHKGEDEWGADGGAAYDNDKLAGSSLREAKVRLAKMQRHFEKKALQCVRIAEALLPDADEEVIAQQALDFMPLPDDSLLETSLRLQAAKKGEEHEGEEEGEEKEEKEKEASLSPLEMYRIMMAEEDAKDEDAEEEEEEKEKEAKKSEDSDEELDEMLDELEEEEAKDAMAELDIDLSPEMDALDSEALMEESDDVLQALMEQDKAAASKKASSQKKVNQLGRVKEAGSTEVDALESLWERAPDVSKVFS